MIRTKTFPCSMVCLSEQIFDKSTFITNHIQLSLFKMWIKNLDIEKQWFSTCGSQTSSISITLELFSMCILWSHPITTESETKGGGVQQIHSPKASSPRYENASPMFYDFPSFYLSFTFVISTTMFCSDLPLLSLFKVFDSAFKDTRQFIFAYMAYLIFKLANYGDSKTP